MRYLLLPVFFLVSYVIQAQISSTFNINTDGWTAPDANPAIAYSAAGGNPGGYVSGNPFIIVFGATTLYVPFYFVAPTLYYGNRSAYYNGTLRYDVQQSTTGGPNQYAEVSIANNLGIVLYYYPPVSNQPPAAPSWATYSVVLNNALGYWKTTNNPAGVAATEVQLQSVLADLANLSIRGLYRDANVNGRLDNVRFTPPIIINTQPTNATVCSGAITTLTTAASGNPTITYQWEIETSPSVWTNVTNTGGYSGATTATLTINTTGNFGAGNYRCRISGINVVDALTNSATLTVNFTAAPTTTGASRCGTGTVALSAAGGAAGQYRWYTVPTGGTAIAGQTNNTYTTPSLSSTTTYHVAINNGTCESTRTAVTATINTIPSAPTTTSAARCGTGSVSLSAAGGAAGQYRWYTVASGGTAIAGQTNNTYTTPSISTTTTYHVAINNGTCESTRTPVTATVNSLPTAPTTTGAESCLPGSVTLNATGGTNGQYRWYTVASGGTALAGETNNAFTTPVLSVTTTYYVAINNGTCESTRTPVVATIATPGCDNEPPIIEPVTSVTPIGGIITINMVDLISDPNDNVDFSTLTIISQPTSGATATIDGNFNLIINYQGMAFTGTENITLQVCDVFAACTQQVLSLEVVGDINVFTAISPNGDTRNDIFLIEHIEKFNDTRENRVSIYNRWGDLVWDGRNYDNTSVFFTGKSNNGSDLPAGTYFYKIEFPSGRPMQVGYLSLKR
ncbi:MAG: gliding motility-associated C-terminal domain-containing protein [Cyclobacteriaceae bacterium]|nr:gliding motility-associated C-terminal domain-containing protein [Cyclobacteriaceae bacterium]